MSQRRQQQSRIPIAAPDISARAKECVQTVLDSGALAAGEEVQVFEEAFANYCEVDHAVATANGTAALHAGLVAAGIGSGDRVLTTPLSFVATANAVRFCGARPVFADVDPETLNLDPVAVRDRVADSDVDAILPVHLYGFPAAMDELAAIAETHDAVLVEDAAQAHGARYRGEHVGSIGDVGTFSFYPTKNMTTGEGGMIVTDDPEIARRARRFVDHGRQGSDVHGSLGHNFRLTNIAAVIGQTQLERLPSFVRSRRANAARLTEAARESDLVVPPAHQARRHAYHQYTVRTDDRDALAAHLDERGVDTSIYYPTPIHEQPAYDEWSVDLPVAEQATERVLSVPVHSELSPTETLRVADALASFDR